MQRYLYDPQWPMSEGMFSLMTDTKDFLFGNALRKKKVLLKNVTVLLERDQIQWVSLGTSFLCWYGCAMILLLYYLVENFKV